MSPRKLTEEDKQEILEQYRNSEATTSTLAKSFEVSSSTISRFLKNKLSSTEYEELIQQKRLARTPRGDKQSKTKSKSGKAKSAKKETAKTKAAKVDKDDSLKGRRKKVNKVVANEDAIPELAVAENLQQDVVKAVATEPAAKPTITRRRRRSTARSSESQLEAAVSQPLTESSTIEAANEEVVPEVQEAAPTAKLVLDDVRSKSESQIIPKSERLILKSERLKLEEDEDEDEDDDEMDILALKEMLGEDLEDINDEDDEDDEWDEDDDTSYTAASNLSDIQILPLSQASLPRTCYLVIDRSAELIVKPLAEFADLGAIPDAETNQRTLPVFDNHRIAKRFSHRRERVIKVPDSRMLQKTSNHLQDKGITRLLIDGQIYSLSQ